ncbi:MAG TPA: type II toxin-antitoxin system HicA family toxin [Candidatus Sulfotelmatobacter sp.]|jgi:predicted RNA binding protein YcfA (HicA-like mRNA interferase family)|nr:type II toxin-antitoxin system HicA family toxin [Candidatus Sulfotelmatobacter sp.]
MKLPRDLSGAELVKLLCKYHGYRRVHQVGSHVILETDSPHHHRLAVPDHDVLRIGTLNSILRAVAEAKGIKKEDVLNLR